MNQVRWAGSQIWLRFHFNLFRGSNHDMYILHGELPLIEMLSWTNGVCNSRCVSFRWYFWHIHLNQARWAGSLIWLRLHVNLFRGFNHEMDILHREIPLIEMQSWTNGVWNSCCVSLSWYFWHIHLISNHSMMKYDALLHH